MSKRSKNLKDKAVMLAYWILGVLERADRSSRARMLPAALNVLDRLALRMEHVGETCLAEEISRIYVRCQKL